MLTLGPPFLSLPFFKCRLKLPSSSSPSPPKPACSSASSSAPPPTSRRPSSLRPRLRSLLSARPRRFPPCFRRFSRRPASTTRPSLCSLCSPRSRSRSTDSRSRRRLRSSSAALSRAPLRWRPSSRRRLSSSKHNASGLPDLLCESDARAVFDAPPAAVADALEPATASATENESVSVFRRQGNHGRRRRIHHGVGGWVGSQNHQTVCAGQALEPRRPVDARRVGPYVGRTDYRASRAPLGCPA
jgi:hypothetical protein